MKKISLAGTKICAKSPHTEQVTEIGDNLYFFEEEGICDTSLEDMFGAKWEVWIELESSDDRIIDLLEAAHASLFFAKAKPRSDDELQNISHDGYIRFLQGKIAGILEAYSEDEEEWGKVYQPAQQRAYDSLPQNIKEELQRKAAEYGLDSPIEV